MFCLDTSQCACHEHNDKLHLQGYLLKDHHLETKIPIFVLGPRMLHPSKRRNLHDQQQWDGLPHVHEKLPKLQHSHHLAQA